MEIKAMSTNSIATTKSKENEDKEESSGNPIESKNVKDEQLISINPRTSTSEEKKNTATNNESVNGNSSSSANSKTSSSSLINSRSSVLLYKNSYRDRYNETEMKNNGNDMLSKEIVSNQDGRISVQENAERIKGEGEGGGNIDLKDQNKTIQGNEEVVSQLREDFFQKKGVNEEETSDERKKAFEQDMLFTTVRMEKDLKDNDGKINEITEITHDNIEVKRQQEGKIPFFGVPGSLSPKPNTLDKKAVSYTGKEYHKQLPMTQLQTRSDTFQNTQSELPDLSQDPVITITTTAIVTQEHRSSFNGGQVPRRGSRLSSIIFSPSNSIDGTNATNNEKEKMKTQNSLPMKNSISLDRENERHVIDSDTNQKREINKPIGSDIKPLHNVNGGIATNSKNMKEEETEGHGDSSSHESPSDTEIYSKREANEQIQLGKSKNIEGTSREASSDKNSTSNMFLEPVKLNGDVGVQKKKNNNNIDNNISENEDNKAGEKSPKGEQLQAKYLNSTSQQRDDDSNSKEKNYNPENSSSVSKSVQAAERINNNNNNNNRVNDNEIKATSTSKDKTKDHSTSYAKSSSDVKNDLRSTKTGSSKGTHYHHQHHQKHSTGPTSEEDIFRNQICRELFGEIGPIQEDYSCAIDSKVLLHGRMYISSKMVCFYCNFFGFEKKIKIPVRYITSITKENTALVIPNAINIITEKKTYAFKSFWDRDEAFHVLNNTLRVYKGLAPEPRTQSTVPKSNENNESQTSSKKDSTLLPQPVSTTLSSQHYPSSAPTRGNGKNESTLSPSKGKEENIRSPAFVTSSSQDTDLPLNVVAKQAQKIVQNTKLQKSISAPSTPSENNDNKQKSKSSQSYYPFDQSAREEKKKSLTTRRDNIEENNSVDVINQSNSTHESKMSPSASTSSLLSQETIWDEFFPMNSSNDFQQNNLNLNKAISSYSLNTHGMEEVFFPGITVVDFFVHFISSRGGYSLETYHGNHGDYNINASSWTNLGNDLGSGKTREVNFTTKLNAIGAPPTAEVCKTQKVTFFGEVGMIWETVTRTSKVKYGDCFTVDDKWVIKAVYKEEEPGTIVDPEEIVSDGNEHTPSLNEQLNKKVLNDGVEEEKQLHIEGGKGLTSEDEVEVEINIDNTLSGKEGKKISKRHKRQVVVGVIVSSTFEVKFSRRLMVGMIIQNQAGKDMDLFYKRWQTGAQEYLFQHRDAIKQQQIDYIAYKETQLHLRGKRRRRRSSSKGQITIASTSEEESKNRRYRRSKSRSHENIGDPGKANEMDLPNELLKKEEQGDDSKVVSNLDNSVSANEQVTQRPTFGISFFQQKLTVSIQVNLSFSFLSLFFLMIGAFLIFYFLLKYDVPLYSSCTKSHNELMKTINELSARLESQLPEN